LRRILNPGLICAGSRRHRGRQSSAQAAEAMWRWRRVENRIDKRFDHMGPRCADEARRFISARPPRRRPRSCATRGSTSTRSRGCAPRRLSATAADSCAEVRPGSTGVQVRGSPNALGSTPLSDDPIRPCARSRCGHSREWRAGLPHHRIRSTPCAPTSGPSGRRGRRQGRRAASP
jgi:hypothetical protein